MHVLRLGSQSVNYANKIIMQGTKTPESSLVVSHQLMKNISLSNLSDADTIQSNDDVEEVFRHRDRIPYYGNQFNYTYMDQRRKPSVDYRYAFRLRHEKFHNYKASQELDVLLELLGECH